MFTTIREAKRTLYTLNLTLSDKVGDIQQLVDHVNALAFAQGWEPYVYVGVTPETGVIDIIASKRA